LQRHQPPIDCGKISIVVSDRERADLVSTTVGERTGVVVECGEVLVDDGEGFLKVVTEGEGEVLFREGTELFTQKIKVITFSSSGTVVEGDVGVVDVVVGGVIVVGVVVGVVVECVEQTSYARKYSGDGGAEELSEVAEAVAHLSLNLSENVLLLGIRNAVDEVVNGNTRKTT